jgi:uncharacterized protein YdhG (YjbR/CyaY superfamily)
MNTTKPETIDEYIAGFPEEIQELLQQVRTTIHKAAPTAAEVISYQMPAFKLNGMLVYFAAFTKHIGFYPTASGISAFKEELSEFKGSKGAMQFAYCKPLPLDLITKIVKFRVNENLLKGKAKYK